MQTLVDQHSLAPQRWQTLLSESITNPVELIQLLQLDEILIPAAQRAAQQFPLRVPRGFIARMQIGNPDDPLLKQVLPLGIELQASSGYSHDPLAEKAVNPIPGLLHKYHGRVLLTVTSACAINCRYCFRRHFPYEENTPGLEGWDKALAYIAGDATINEVIFSGGDPLAASDRYLAKLVAKLEAIPHVKTLRIHSRMPIILPERINFEMLSWFTMSRLRPVLVTHCNHAQEIAEPVKQAMYLLREARVTLLNQSVLLRGINDTANDLIQLSHALFEIGILPYYLHLLDKVQGAAHFDLDEAYARQLVWEAAQRLPGYLVPKLVREIPGQPAKTPVPIL